MPDRAFSVSAINARGILHLKVWGAAPDVTPLIASHLGREARILALAPGEWWLVSDTSPGSRLLELAASAADRQQLAVVDLSRALSTLRLQGDVRPVLETGTSLDLHPRRFPVGSCTRTRFAQLAVVIDFVDANPSYDLYVSSSYEPYLLSWLEKA